MKPGNWPARMPPNWFSASEKWAAASSTWRRSNNIENLEARREIHPSAPLNHQSNRVKLLRDGTKQLFQGKGLGGVQELVPVPGHRTNRRRSGGQGGPGGHGQR